MNEEKNKSRIQAYIESLQLDMNMFPDDIPMDYEKLGLDAFHPSGTTRTGVRGHMGMKALDTAMPAVNYDLPYMLTGMEVAMTPYITDIAMPEDGQVVSKIKINQNKFILLYTTMEDELKHILCVNHIHTYEKFGFPLWFSEDFLSCTPGTFLKKGTKLAYSNQVQEGAVAFGQNVVAMSTTLGGNGEDSIIISESLAKRLEYYTYPQVVLDVDSSDLLLNTNGTMEDYRPIPDVGDTIRTDGVVMGKRSISSMYSLAMMSDKALMEFNEAFDRMVFINGGEDMEVVDIDITTTDSGSNKYPKVFEQINEIVNTRKKINSIINQKISAHKRVSPKTIKLAVDNISSNKSKRLKHKGKPVFIRIVLTIRKIERVRVNSKLTGVDGNKGIICGIYPDRMMPILEDGTRVEYMDEAMSVPGRNNSSVITIGALSYAYVQMQKDIRHRFGLDIHKNSYDIYDLDSQSDVDVDWAIDFYMGFLKTINSPLYKTFLEINDEERYDILYDILTDNFRSLLDGPERSLLIALEDLNQSRYMIRKQKGTIGLNGKTEEIITPFAPRIMTVIIQNKLGDQTMAATCPFENHYNLATTRKGNNKASRQNNYSAIQFAGAPDMRIFTSYVDPRAVMNFVEIGKSPQVRNEVYKNILEAEEPSNVDHCLDREKIKFGKDPFTRVYQSITRSMGYIPTYKKFHYSEDEKMIESFRSMKWKMDIELFKEKE